ncbi:hypothetical protein G6F70_001459 [Rhizopus microsporus]|nr:hypothetical protein G6F71_007714 [Rhizopus microsporus]KAG1203381.1 hypothetical protein G6F70_001459 [Rhizopus microsporus]KAG1207813.1 hypothetical protein G6F69_007739 [Rhizopus microsporus]KAG1236470.1 hypothetical protein G6F67_001954 [Rhizopus microsporus]KAG1260709.1 hypothetical protein G6F68_007237 [Rhizopus microsporus]
MKLEEDHELDIFEKPCVIAIPHGTSDYISFAVKEQEDQIPASHYLKYECAFKWTRAYQIQILTNVETNNYIESWHDQLKTNYLQRKRNRRLDRLIFILIDDVHDNFMHNTARMAANIGQDMVQKVYIEEEVCYIVKSFTTEVVYDISTEQGMMTACNCIDFQRNKRASKVDCHDSNKRNATVYLRHCLETDSSLRVHTMGETALIQNTVENDHSEATTNSSDVLQSEVPSDAGDKTDEVLTNITNICRQALESRIQLTSENNNRLSRIYNELRQLLSVNEEMQPLPNINLQTQRR